MSGMLNLALLDWATPWGAWLALAPLLLSWLAHRRRSKVAAWAEPQLQAWAEATKGEGERRMGRRLAAWLAWGLLALAAAGPRLPLDEKQKISNDEVKSLFLSPSAFDIRYSIFFSSLWDFFATCREVTD